jgi:hypothetical protein
LLALWICRVSVASVGIGLLLFWGAPQARDLFRDVSGGLGAAGLETSQWKMFINILTFLLFLVVFWALPVHTMARWSLEAYDRINAEKATFFGNSSGNAAETLPNSFLRSVATLAPFRYVPPLLGLLCLFGVTLGLWLAKQDHFGPQIQTERLVQEQLDWLLYGILIIWVIYVTYVLCFSNRTRGKQQTNSVSRSARIYARSAAGVATAVAIVFIWFPNFFGATYRLQLVPVVLGLWVPILSIGTNLSYRVQVPLIFIGTAILLFFLWFHEGHEIRSMVAGDASGKRLAQIDFDDAVVRWQIANGCEKDPNRCPHPIIVTAAGGASRAAFMTASVLGFFMDETCPSAPELPANQKPEEKPAGCSVTPIFANRVFAISAVSGGALGAAVFAAMLREHQAYPNPSGEPCRGASSFWFRTTPPRGWRECLQAVLSADFLSPAILGLAFRDPMAMLHYFWPQYLVDRAGILEQAWSDNFRELVLDPGLSEEEAANRGLDAPFDAYGPQDTATWRPLLIMNGTSTGTGRRILTSHLAARAVDPLFSDAYETRALLNGGTLGSSAPRTVSLVTAITNSARFPLISPPGVIRDLTGHVVDRVVDGGYFENGGITTANELAIALGLKKLRPVILQLTNDPISVYRVRQLDAHPNSKPLLPEESDRLLAAGLRAPFLALYNTRSARADLVIIRASQMPEGAPVAHATVYGQAADGGNISERPVAFRDVSMSWWLSKPMQEYIDTQLFDDDLSDGEQKKMLQRVCSWLQHPSDKAADLSTRCNDSVERAFNRPTARATQ